MPARNKALPRPLDKTTRIPAGGKPPKTQEDRWRQPIAATITWTW
jgi:hypothetical protein